MELIFFHLTIAVKSAVVCRGKPRNLRKCCAEFTEFFSRKLWFLEITIWLCLVLLCPMCADADRHYTIPSHHSSTVLSLFSGLLCGRSMTFLFSLYLFIIHDLLLFYYSITLQRPLLTLHDCSLGIVQLYNCLIARCILSACLINEYNTIQYSTMVF